MNPLLPFLLPASSKRRAVLGKNMLSEATVSLNLFRVITGASIQANMAKEDSPMLFWSSWVKEQKTKAVDNPSLGEDA